MNTDIQEQVRALQKQFKEHGEKSQSKLDIAVNQGAMLVEAKAKHILLQGEHTGPHLGTPPHSHGNMIQEITHRLEHGEKGESIGVAGIALQEPPYPMWLEFGTPKQINISYPYYPWLQPAFDAVKQEINELIRRALTQ